MQSNAAAGVPFGHPRYLLDETACIAVDVVADEPSHRQPEHDCAPRNGKVSHPPPVAAVQPSRYPTAPAATLISGVPSVLSQLAAEAYLPSAETIVLALEGRFENFTVGRNIEWEKVRDIYRLGRKHGMKLAAISGVNGPFSDADIRRVRRLALAARSRENAVNP